MNPLRLIYPKIPARSWGQMLLVTLAGALVGGAYGVLHDQVTYSISEEYFTRFKFNQFAYAEPPIDSPRWFAGNIGFLATWWVGALVAWVLARISVSKEGALPPIREFAIAFGIVFLVSICAAVVGFGWGEWRRTTGYAEGWLSWMGGLGVENIESFMTVGYIHNSSYIGGVVGMVFGILYLSFKRRRRARSD